jgi:FMN phosphatase YigB (HAD superfamily)
MSDRAALFDMDGTLVDTNYLHIVHLVVGGAPARWPRWTAPPISCGP